MAVADAPQWQVGFQAAGKGAWYTPSGFPTFCKHRLQSFQSRFCLDELSGAVGDFGVLIPLLASCAKLGSVKLGPAMFWMGIFNVISAVQWDIPMPVQPMKSIAAVAISEGMDPGVFAAAGIITGATVWILGATQMIDAVNRLIPKCVISGMQVGLGVKMAAKGCSYWHINGAKAAGGGWVDDLDCKLTMLLCLMATLLMVVRTKLPTALIIFVVGLILTIIQMVNNGVEFSMGFLNLEMTVPQGKEWVTGLIEGAIPQLPLTTLNSVVSVCALSVDLFRDEKDGGKGVSRMSVASSVGLMNVVGCFFGGMPSCHGAGGLAGQFKFGARGGMAILMLGIAKIILSLCLGETLDALIVYYPLTILGVLLLFAGVELATVGAKGIWKSSAFEEDMLPCFVTAGAYIGTKNMALGVSAGVLAALVQRLDQYHTLPALIMGWQLPDQPPLTNDKEASKPPAALPVEDSPPVLLGCRENVELSKDSDVSVSKAPKPCAVESQV
jgi:MFS superfamily sulfate permease-like transporter